MKMIRTRSIPTVDMPGRMPLIKGFSVDHAGMLIRDELLTSPTPKEWAAYAAAQARVDLGTVWDGIILPMLEGLDPDQKQKVIDSFDAYRRARSTATGDTEDSFLGRSSADSRNLNRSINDANRAFWDKRKSS